MEIAHDVTNPRRWKQAGFRPYSERHQRFDTPPEVHNRLKAAGSRCIKHQCHSRRVLPKLSLHTC